MAAPFWSQQHPAIVSSRENTKRGQDLLDNALAFRMPGAFVGRPRSSPLCPAGGAPAAAAVATGGEVEAAAGGEAEAESSNGGALRAISTNSPPRTNSPLSRSGVSKRGRGAQRGRLGAVKLAATPPRDEEQRQQRLLSRSSSPTRGGRGRDPDPAAEGSPSPPAAPRGAGGILRRMSFSASPPRRGLVKALARVLPFGGGGGGGSRRETAGGEPSPCATPTATESRAAAGVAPRRMIVEGSRIDLRNLDRAKGGGKPRAYSCRDGSVVVIGRERMLSVLPDERATASGDGGGGGGGVVTWVLRYRAMESCCINVSAAKESERSVGDVVVEVTTR